ncbi:NAD(P)H-dependent oxidoreductase [Paenibacillus sp. GCM10023252]|uniref:NAD(P)H-dependent oxidoreductase n=1 Tax=Paenibacillus sp. GCM10023252 TaxID=3252649 RepID=UPI0036209A0E
MRTLVIVAHPRMEASRVNRALAETAATVQDVTVHNLYEVYPDEKVDAAREQALLEAHDRIILQFPFYWYSSPSLLKKWQDEVLAYGWAYGSGGDRLHGKELGLAVSTGGPAEAYRPDGYNRYTLEELLLPLRATSNLVGTIFLPIFSLSGVRTMTDEELAGHAQSYAAYLTQPIAEVSHQK